jgi:hypothetical protein
MIVRVAFSFLAVVGCGAFTGLLLTIGMSFGKFWKSLTPEGVLDWFSSHPKGAAQALPFTLLPALAGLGGSLWFDWSDPLPRNLWLSAIGATLVNLAFTIAYFFPINGKFENRSISPVSVPSLLDRWLACHWIRIALAFLASLLAFLAVRH